jgi:arsenate reductase
MYTFYQYPSCSTCRKALKFLNEKEIEFVEVHLVTETPNEGVLKEILKNSGLPLKKLFNTSGKKYKELNLKDKISSMAEDEGIKLLASDGMLIKRPIISDGKKVLIGFKEEEWIKL